MNTSSLLDTSISHGDNSEAIRNSITSLGDDNSIDKLCTGLSSKLRINCENQANSTNHEQKIPIGGYYMEEEDEEEEYSDAEEKEDEEVEEEFLALMRYAKSAHRRENTNKSQTQKLLEESLLAQMGYLKNEPPKHEPITTPMAELNLVSAFKGSREKEGVPTKEHRVSWAPDVYDPPPNVYDPPPTSERQKAKGLAGKNRQKGRDVKKAGDSENEGGGGKGKKGGGSKGGVEKGKSSGKDKDKKYVGKKQGKKHGGSASKCCEFGEF